MKKEFGRAIREIRERQKLTQTDIGDKIGADRGTISRYENGNIAPDFERLTGLAEALGVSLGKLFDLAGTGQGGVEEGPDIKGTVPLISWVQAGSWQEVIDNLQPGEGERIATTYNTRRRTYALRVRGDSMEPKFPDGAILIVEPDETPDSGAYVIVRQNGNEATFKQYVQDGDTRYLKPINPRYPIMELKPDAVFCGVVKRVEMDV